MSGRFFPHLNQGDIRSEGFHPCRYSEDCNLYDFHYTLKPITTRLRAEAVCNELIRQCS